MSVECVLYSGSVVCVWYDHNGLLHRDLFKAYEIVVRNDLVQDEIDELWLLGPSAPAPVVLEEC